MALLGCALVLGASLAPPAGAVSTKNISLAVPMTNGVGAILFLLGEDGAIWYTVIAPGGTGLTFTGNAKNPFDGAFQAPSSCGTIFLPCNGFVDSTSLASSCMGLGETCAEIYARIPGPGTFIASPTVQDARPLCTKSTVIIATGGDNRFYYTLFDSHNAGTATTMDATCPGADPFNGAAEDKNVTGSGDGTGFVKQSSLAARCAALGRTCVGAWVQFPK